MRAKIAVSLLESISDGFIVFDTQWRCTYGNPAAAKILGNKLEELEGKSLWELWPLRPDSEFGVSCRRAVAEKAEVQMEAWYPEPVHAWLEILCHPSADGLLLYFRDITQRKRADEQMRIMASATSQTSDGVLIHEISGDHSCSQTPVFANPAFERITGFKLQELQQGALALLYPGGNPHARTARPYDFRSSCPPHVEQRAVRKDGSEFWGEWTFKPLTDERGNFTHCVWTCRDVTERKCAEEKSELLAAIVESSNDAIIGKSLDGIVVSWNKGAEDIYGYTAQEMIGRPISILTPEDHAAELTLFMDDLRRGRRIQHYETERLTKDGRRIRVSLNMSPIQNADGYIIGASVITRDINERKLAEIALARSEERYRSLAFATSQIVWSTNSQGGIEDDMPLWREFTGQSREEIRGWGWIKALHPDDHERTSDLWMRSVRNRSFYRTEYRLRRKDGEYRYMAVHGVPVLERDGIIREWVSTAADITERVRAEEEVRLLDEKLEKRVVERTAELEAANKELEAFAYSVSHDLRAPLRAVDGFSRILLEEYAPQLPSEAQHYLQVARNNALQMGSLIDGLLAFSRLGRQPLRRQTVLAGELVRQVLEDMRPDYAGRAIEIVVGQLPPCEADPLLLKQVFVNLISNALKYTRGRQVAKIEVSSCDGVYYVRDNGVGFDMRYEDKLFGVFQRLHSAEEYEGTGVGLAFVQRIVHRHGGRVWANARVDQGATFYFTLDDRSGRGACPEAGEGLEVGEGVKA